MYFLPLILKILNHNYTCGTNLPYTLNNSCEHYFKLKKMIDMQRIVYAQHKLEIIWYSPPFLNPFEFDIKLRIIAKTVTRTITVTIERDFRIIINTFYASLNSTAVTLHLTANNDSSIVQIATDTADESKNKFDFSLSHSH